MELSIQAAGLCVTAALLALVVRRGSPESALASVVETAGAVCALIAALPLLRAVLGLLQELMR